MNSRNFMKTWAALAVLAVLTVASPVLAADTDSPLPRLRLSFGQEHVVVTLSDNAASRDLLTMLPLSLTFEDYNRKEKISYLPRKLNTGSTPSRGKAEIGSVTYYAPWGNMAIFYGPFDFSPGLLPLGQVDSGIEKLAAQRGTFAARLEVLP